MRKDENAKTRKLFFDTFEGATFRDWRVLYGKYNSMLYACRNKNNNNYKYYGGRNISVCQEWENDIYNYVKDVIKKGYTPFKKVGIDRINNDGNYEPSNIRIVSHRQNCLNRRRLRSTNITGYEGVCFRSDSKKYRAYITVDGKNNRLGTHKTIKECVEARNDFIIQNNLQHEYKIQEYVG